MERSLRCHRLGHELDPEEVFLALFAAEPYAFWLDTSRVGPDQRFSFVGASSGPGMEVLRARTGRGVTRHTPEGTTHLTGSVFDVLAERLAARTSTDLGPLPVSAACGYVGYFGYEAETGEAPGPHRSSFPDAIWVAASRFVVVDHVEAVTWIVATETDRDTDSAWWRRAVDLLTRMERSPEQSLGHQRALLADEADEPPVGVDPEPWLVRSKAQYLRDVEACLEQLRAGNSYEICLTNTAELAFPDAVPGAVLRVYRRLRRSNPAPYGAYLRFGDIEVLSSSPERFLSVDTDRVARASPIKGTAPRDSDPAADAALGKALADEEKTRAENLMIVDLLRNDLGRVCEPGTITVPDFLAVESYTTVHQLVSTIRGRLRTDVDAVGAARACFPPGSMTGAPKLAAMRILERLEARARGVYSGAVGMFGLGGTAELSVVIRTAVVHGGGVSVGAGGAIVLDSEPRAEYVEMVLKAGTPLRAFPRPEELDHTPPGVR